MKTGTAFNSAFADHDEMPGLPVPADGAAIAASKSPGSRRRPRIGGVLPDAATGVNHFE
jgi:hypothetical protein